MSQRNGKSSIWYDDENVRKFLNVLLGENIGNVEVNTLSHRLELVNGAIQNFLATEKTHLFLPVLVHSVNKDFTQLNHWVGCHIVKMGGSISCHYFDPMGHDIHPELKTCIEGFAANLKIHKVQLQIANLKGHGDAVFYEGNSDDCGPMLCYMLAKSFYGQLDDLVQVSLQASRELGQILRAAHSSNMTLDMVQGFIAIGGKDRVTAVLHDESAFRDHVLYGRDEQSNNFAGQIMLNSQYSLLDRIKMATIFAANKNYSINSYLNINGMDSHAMIKVGGLTLIHAVIFLSRKLDYTAEGKKAIGEFFKVLQKRNIEASDTELFNPNYPTMNPEDFNFPAFQVAKPLDLLAKSLKKAKVSDSQSSELLSADWLGGRWKKEERVDTDRHMISTELLLNKIHFKSEGVRVICKKYFSTLKSYYDQRSYEDDSGDSEDEQVPAHAYKEHLLELDKFIRGTCKTTMEPSPKATRTMDKHESEWVYVFKGLDIFTDDGSAVDITKWKKMWKSLNDATLGEEGIDPDKFVVPLFHGVPMMSSQYTNFERREIFKKFAAINKKLIGRYNGEMGEDECELTEEEEIILDIHSRTATASNGIQSLYEMINAPVEILRRLAKTDETLLDYFAGHASDASFKEAMKIFIFEFMSNKTAHFWDRMKECSKSKEFPDQCIVKYRFPSIATSKTPDHPSKFAIGNNVEGNTRGETAMKPDYVDGMPTHRFAGLLYVTFHRLQDLDEAFSNGTGIDVNRALDLKEIKATNGFAIGNLQNQQEVDFFGKSKGQVVAVIPVIYPHIRKDGEITPGYHQAIWGINPKAPAGTICNPQKILQDLQSSPNPAVGNQDSFGKVMMPTLVGLAHGVVLAVSDAMEVFACTITKEREIKPYVLSFDHGSTARSEMHKQLSITSKAAASPAGAWEVIAERRRQDLDGSFTKPEDVTISDEEEGDNESEIKPIQFSLPGQSNDLPVEDGGAADGANMDMKKLDAALLEVEATVGRDDLSLTPSTQDSSTDTDLLGNTGSEST